MSFFSADPLKCTKCGTCIAVCPAVILRFGDSGFPEMSDSQAGACIKCGHCVMFCPACANSLSFIREPMVSGSQFKLPLPEESIALLKTRRSVRRFKKEPVPRDVIEEILAAAKMAPSACNDQPVRWIITESQDATKKIFELMLEWLRQEIFKAPTSRIAIAGAQIIANAREGGDVLLRGAPQTVVAVVPKSYLWPEDGVIALTYFELAAYALGAGTCWAGFFVLALRNCAELRKYLGIKDDERICGAHMLGWPAIKPTRQLPPRREQNINWI